MSDTRPLAELIDEVCRIYPRSIETRIEVGRLLLEIKETVGHGHFLPTLRSLCKGTFPFRIRQAETFMRLAEGLGPNSQHAANFPTSVRAASRICGLETQKFRAAIADGRIHPTMTEHEAKALVRRVKASKDIKPKAGWSVICVRERLIKAVNAEIDGAPTGSTQAIADLLRELANQLEDAARPEVQDAVAEARQDLEVHDAEPGGFRIYEDERQASTHPGSPAVIASCKSTYPPWYRELTTRRPHVTPLTRKQIEARLEDLEMGRLPTARTTQTYLAVRGAVYGH